MRTAWPLALLLVGCAEPGPGGDAPPTDDPAPAVAPTRPDAVGVGHATLRRLTRAQYHHALRDLFGDALVLPSQLEPDVAVEGLTAVGAALASVSSRGVELYEAAAFQVAEQVVDDPDVLAAVLPCTPEAAVDPTCAAALVRDLGRRAWRRPLTPDEVDRVVGVMGQAGEVLGTFDDGLRYGLALLLQSPSFLFREEVGEEGDDGVRRFTGYELAARLSFLLWDSIPDDELLDAAAAGELATEAGLRAQAERMLADPRAERGVRTLFTDLLDLDALDRLTKDPFVFPHTSATLGPAAREQTLRDVTWLVLEQDADVRDLLTSTVTHIDRELAAVYEVPAPSRAGFRRVELPPEAGRVGLLGQVSFLAAQAHPVSSSATLRGMFVRERLLCHDIPPPPAGVDTSIPEPDANARTLRERIRVHLESPSCSGCHQVTDPIGLAFENFDGIGRWRTTENGAPIDPSGELDGERAFADAVGLASVLREHPDLPACLVRRVTTYALGREPVAGEEALLAFLTEHLAWSGYRLRQLVVELVASPSFREASPPGEDAP